MVAHPQINLKCYITAVFKCSYYETYIRRFYTDTFVGNFTGSGNNSCILPMVGYTWDRTIYVRWRRRSNPYAIIADFVSASFIRRYGWICTHACMGAGWRLLPFRTEWKECWYIFFTLLTIPYHYPVLPTLPDYYSPAQSPAGASMLAWD